MKNKDMDSRIEELENMVKIQCSDGNWNYDEYMHGMANGLLLALATVKGVEPEFLDPPERWLSDDGEKPLTTVGDMTDE